MIDPERLHQLERLARLKEAGALSEDEFAQEKMALLAPHIERQSPRRPSSVPPVISPPRRGNDMVIAAVVLCAAAGAIAWLLSPAPSTLPPPQPQVRPARIPTAESRTTASQPAQLADLAAVIRFSNPAQCEYSNPLKRLFFEMWRYDEHAHRLVGGDPITIPGIGRGRPQFKRTVREEGGAEFSASLPLEGRWYGLHVRRLFAEGVEESDMSSNQIRFLESPATVREVLNRHGFRLPPVGRYRELEPGAELPGTIGVAAVPGGATLTCS